MGDVHFRVLGSLEVANSKGSIPVGTTQEGALLALLLVRAGEVISAGRLIEDLWRGQAPAQAAATLRTYVRDLRRLVDPGRLPGSASEVLVTRRPGYLLQVGPDDLDAWRFERLANEGRRALASSRPRAAAEGLRSALGLWRGTAFGEFSTEPFALAEVARLEEQRLSALEARVEADLALGRHGELVAELEALVAEHPYRERLWAHLLLALYRAGRQAEALRAYARLRCRLGEELGIEPSKSLRMLEEAILLQRPELELTAQMEGPPVSAGDVDIAMADPRLIRAGTEISQHSAAGIDAAKQELLSFLFTDVEGSAALWEEQPGPMASAMARLHQIVAHVVATCDGTLVNHRGKGDSAVATFKLASDAVTAAARLAMAFTDEPWPAEVRPRIRTAVSTGEADERHGDYSGCTLVRAAGLRSVALGGEVLLDESTAALVADALPPGTRVVDLGWQELPDLQRAEHAVQLQLQDASETHGPMLDREVPAALSSASSSHAFVGRSLELDALAHAWSKVRGGHRALVAITGEPGIGKTGLAAEFARRVHDDGGIVLYGRWDEADLWSYQAFREALGDYARSCSKARLEADVRDCGRDLARLLPNVVERVGGGVPLRADSETERYRLFEAINSWLSNIAARQPVLLVLDDLHWADKPSLLLLRHLMRAPDAALLVIATYCHTEIRQGDDVSSTLAELRRSGRLERVALGGLAAEDVLAILEATAGRPMDRRGADLANLLVTETAGNPFFLTEIVRCLSDNGILLSGEDMWDTNAGIGLTNARESISEVVQARLSRLSERGRRLLSAAAVGGQEFEARIVGDAADASGEALVEDVEEALRAGVLIEASYPDDIYAFAHSVVRHMLYDNLSHTRRTYLHYRVGIALERRYGTEDSHLSTLAYHFWAGSYWASSAKRAIHYARLAGEKAVHEVAYEDAARHYRRALELLDHHRLTDPDLRYELLLALGDAYNRAGDVAAGADRFVEAAEVARRLDSPEQFARAALGLGGVRPQSAEPYPQAHSLLQEALRMLGRDDSPERALALARLANWMHSTGPRDERVALCHQAISTAHRLGCPATRAAVLTYAYWALEGPDNLDQQLSMGLEIARLGEQLDDSHVVLQGLRCQLQALFEIGDMKAAHELAARMSCQARALRQPEYLRWAVTWDAMTAAMEGCFAEADRLAAETRRLLQQSGHPQTRAFYFGIMLPGRWLRGRMGEVLPRLRPAAEGRTGSVISQAFLAWACAETGQSDRARAILDEISPVKVRQMDRNLDWWVVVAALANTVVLLGATEWVPTLRMVMLPYADLNATMGQSGFLGAVSHYLGTVAALGQEWDEAFRHLDSALERHRSMGARPFVALTQQVYASALVGRGMSDDLDRARRAEREALAIARKLDLQAITLRQA